MPATGIQLKIEHRRHFAYMRKGIIPESLCCSKTASLALRSMPFKLRKLIWEHKFKLRKLIWEHKHVGL